MKCKKCGEELPEEFAFCPKCGEKVEEKKDVQNVDVQKALNNEKKDVEKVEPKASEKEIKTVENKEKTSEEQEPKTEKNKMSGGKIAGIIIACIAVVAIAIFAWMQFSSNQDQKETLSQKIQRFETDLPNLNISGDVSEIEEGIRLCKQLIENQDLQNAEVEANRVGRLMDELVGKNNEYIKDKISKIDETDQSLLSQEDSDGVKTKKEEIENLVSQNQFVKANEEVEKLIQLVTSLTTPKEKIKIQVKQVDVSSFPKIKLYADITDESGKVPTNLEQVFFHIEEKDANAQYVKKIISKASQLDQEENLNVDMVMDVSGSMAGDPLNNVKRIMNSFIDSVQFNSGDLVELTTFSSGVSVNCEFTSDKTTLKNRVNSFIADGLTSLYDALYLSVNRVAAKSGAKCVIAFTDGLDNNSKASVSDVINQATKYKIPIFLIGSGTGTNSDLNRIATQTGGFYKNISSITSLQEIYDQIYRQQKQLYLVEYEDDNSQMHENRNIKLSYKSKDYAGEEEYDFQPTLLISTDSTLPQYGEGPEATVVNYLKNFVVAITNKDFSKISSYLLEGSSIYDTQKEYVKKNIEEKLLSYEILNVTNTDSNNAIVSTRETYWVTQNGKLIEMLTQECKYKVTKSGNDWKLTDFAENVNVVSRISYE